MKYGQASLADWNILIVSEVAPSSVETKRFDDRPVPKARLPVYCLGSGPASLINVNSLDCNCLLSLFIVDIAEQHVRLLRNLAYLEIFGVARNSDSRIPYILIKCLVPF